MKHFLWQAPTWLGALIYLGGVFAALVALLLQATPSDWGLSLTQSYLWRLIQFSFTQALLSALLSIVLAIPVISALYHNQFLGRRWLLNLFAVSIVVPTIVAILGIVIVYGRQGWFTSLFGFHFPLYGLGGILLAHVFFNLPLVVRLGLQVYGLIPDGQWRLATQLGLNRWQAFRVIEWPYLRRSLPGTFLLVFLLCFSSFAVVLSLGGGPKSSTLEVAIYQALRFEFDLSKASFLALLQVSICLALGGFVFRYIQPLQQDASLYRGAPQLRRRKRDFVVDLGSLMLAAVWIVPPFVAVLTPIWSAEFLVALASPGLWQATLVSLQVAIPSGLLSLMMALSLVSLARGFLYLGCSRVMRYLEQSANLVLMLPGLVLATGLFLLLRHTGGGINNAYWVVVWVNAVMALPFVVRAIAPAMLQQQQRYGHLYEQYAILGWIRFKLEWSAIRKALAQGLAYAVLLSLGDLGVVALFGSQGLETLPLYLYRLIGSYRVEQGSSVAVVLVLLCVALFFLITRCVGGRDVTN
ncbi:thiamine/thiamine pyrophosphate ABC transporter, permease protein [Maribrevibacterium harenarium]|uniref:Thiamine transport system permease protein ThiP n=1 Tax=Maribrevibacterium harenarium TaxID=2589817 RepID=A0A501X2F7_9GAMM|nr:thiamine/thiamine pyrophosphate ABC transporter permease [Maribrevibacterium harenarium]TPE54671.1 thiamine/thiamine pyrophosphate ABC transporter, permease protein [Maribrevibacterium harenarium]